MSIHFETNGMVTFSVLPELFNGCQFLLIRTFELTFEQCVGLNFARLEEQLVGLEMWAHPPTEVWIQGHCLDEKIGTSSCKHPRMLSLLVLRV